MPKMAERPSRANQEILRLADIERRRLAHPHLGDEHLLLAMLAHTTSTASKILIDLGLTLHSVRADIARIAEQAGPISRDDASLLNDIGVDIARIRRQLESTFGAVAVHEAARQVRRRPWWRGRAHPSPLCGPPLLIKRAQFIACTTAGKQHSREVRPEHLLYGLLSDARDPIGTGLGRRGRRDSVRRGLPIGAPHPVRTLLAEHGIDIDELRERVLANSNTAAVGEQ